ncbi:peptidase S41 [Brevundimonas sp. GW460-12-10-14-LB2]|jgi:carboxyl-terminal processing protease|uniref:S41 family peptidase n=1 Tax=Brevundimonas sp. GW460-12-10-14-LB2 TaxID=1827469 RepID=UPI0007BCD677|nr:S41 family peptidase [Brevundimonas sp. GW460-12-10-14-LB2]ANC54800.1 peptidase S41 [Brevundimonas sp. GW460-12-10-14-LB2]MEA3473522.1 S41 family peptidase [Pseudomonadota bacterium]
MRKLLLVGCAALVLGGSAAAVSSQTPRNETFRMLELFGDVVGIVEQAYVVPVDNKKLIEAALAGMMTALDPHSNYLPPSNYDDLRERTEGQYSGVGLTISADGGMVKVISPMDDSPAAKAGVQAGDVISSIEGQNAAGLTVSQVSEKLRGAVGTSVKVTFLRDGSDPLEVTLTREVIKVQSVTGRVEGDFGYLRVSTFNENTGRELNEAIAKIKAEKPGVKGYVLDLRNNGGGLLNAAIDVSDAFLERGEIVSQRGRKPEQIQRYSAKPGDITGGLPLVVLVNYGSASASEIVAGALKDHQRATIVGLTSFGKGSVQTVIPLRQGQDGALSITTARYYTPSGASIQKIGIEPDLEVARNEAEARIVSRSSFIYSEAAYATALDASIGAERKGPHTPREAPGEKFDKDKDYQLQRALDVLRAGGDLSKLSAPPEGIVVTEPGSTPKPDAEPTADEPKDE